MHPGLVLVSFCSESSVDHETDSAVCAATIIERKLDRGGATNLGTKSEPILPLTDDGPLPFGERSFREAEDAGVVVDADTLL